MGLVPTLRLSDARSADQGVRDRFARRLRAGIEETGFCVLEDHGVPGTLVSQVRELFLRFFALSEVEKAACGGSEGGQRGYTPFGVERARDAQQPDLKAFFHVGPPLARYPANRWPAAVPGLRRAALDLHAELARCAEQLLAALASAYSLPPDSFRSLAEGGNSILRAAYYPRLSGSAVPGALRAAAHEDINLITLLCSADEAGLEILTPAGEWLAVDCEPEQIVVDSGDMLKWATAGVIPATTHRVVNPPVDSPAAHRARLSLPFFAHPAPECDLTPLPSFATPEGLERYPPITAGAYLDQRLKEIGLRDRVTKAGADAE